MTQQLLAFSRKQILQPRPLDLDRIVRELQPMLTRLVGEDVEVTVKFHATPATVYADPSQLEQVIMNLAVNARDAMPGGGRLCIETDVTEPGESGARSHTAPLADAWIVLTVSDQGVGMDEEIRRQIFEPFFTTKRPGTGTGLGLSMIQGIVEQSGGYIEVDSVPGRGTIFRIFLPAVKDGPGDAAGPESSVVPVPNGKETVLVVEDQAEVRHYVAEALRGYGYRVIPAESANEALRLCDREQHAIDLLLTDVVMPNVSGRELADMIAKRWPHTKVLFMSGYTDDAVMRHGVLQKGTQIIQKPFSPDQLAGRVRELLTARARPPRILVADDEAAVRRFLRTILEQGGYEVVEAADGREAIKEVHAGQVDLLITDLVMPVQEGLETISALGREAAGIGIIAISGAFGGSFLEAAAGLGAHAVLKKPVNGDLLLAKVAEVLKSRR